MKAAWSALLVGIAVVFASATYMWDILILLTGILSASAGITALFLNAKRMEALEEAKLSDVHEPAEEAA